MAGNPKAAAAVQLIRSIEPALIQHLTEGRTGHDFADWFLAGYGIYYEPVISAGAEQLGAFVMQTSEPVRKYAELNAARYRAFIEEFVAGPDEDEEEEAPKVVPINT